MSSNKIDRLLELYPPERVNRTRQKLDAFWNGGEMSGLPFTLRRRDVPVGLNHNDYELSFFTFDDALNAQIDDRLLKACMPDDYVPSLITGNSPYYLSVAFGCRW